MDWIFFSILLLLLVLASAGTSAAEISLFSLPTLHIKHYRRHAESTKRLIAQLLESPNELLVTILMLNIAINILIQNVASHLLRESGSMWFTVGIPFLLTLVFCEIVPKTIALDNNVRIASAAAPAIFRAKYFLGPFRRGISWITTYVSKLLFFFLKKEPELTKEELEHIIKSSGKLGILSDEESELVQGYLDLQDVTVKEIMRPRDEILYYDLENPLEGLVHLFVDLEVSRMPVCKGSLDNIQGVVTAHDFFLHQKKIRNPKDILSIVRKPFYVPESMAAWSLYRQFKEKREVLSLIVDEYGVIEGLVTMEDLMEIVVGDIQDHRDTKPLYTVIGKNVLIASGKLELAVFEDMFNIALPNPHNLVTISGWLIDRIGDIPKGGDKYELESFFFHILAADQKRIRRLYIRKLKEKEQHRHE